MTLKQLKLYMKLPNVVLVSYEYLNYNTIRICTNIKLEIVDPEPKRMSKIPKFQELKLWLNLVNIKASKCGSVLIFSQMMLLQISNSNIRLCISDSYIQWIHRRCLIPKNDSSKLFDKFPWRIN